MEIYLSRRRSWFRKPSTVETLQTALNLSDVREISEVHEPSGSIISVNGHNTAAVLVDIGGDTLYEISDVIIHPAEDGTPATVVLDCVPKERT